MKEQIVQELRNIISQDEKVPIEHLSSRIVMLLIGNDDEEDGALLDDDKINWIADLASSIEIHNGDPESMWHELKTKVNSL